MHKYNLTTESRGYAPELAWVRYIKKLVFASSDHPPSTG